MPRTARRAALALAATALLTAGAAALPPAATAAEEPTEPVKPVCNLLVDALGDTTPVQSPHLDVRSGDVASTATSVAGVLRLRSLALRDDYAATGARWDLSFTVDGARYVLTLRRAVTGTYSSTMTRAYGLGDPVAVYPPPFLIMGDAIQWMVPRALIPELPATPAGDPISGLSARTYGTPAELDADVALSSRTYADGSPSCVKTR